MSDMPSMMASDGTETDSFADTFFSNIFANTALSVFFIVPSQLATNQGAAKLHGCLNFWNWQSEPFLQIVCDQPLKQIKLGALDDQVFLT